MCMVLDIVFLFDRNLKKQNVSFNGVIFLTLICEFTLSICKFAITKKFSILICYWKHSVGGWCEMCVETGRVVSSYNIK